MTLPVQRTQRSWRRTLTAALCLMGLCFAASGCNYIVLLGYLIGGPPSIEPDFDAMTKKSLTEKEVIVAVACYAPKEVLYDHANIDKEVARMVSYRLRDHKITVRHPDVVLKWLDENPDYDQPEEIGEGVQVTHLIYIDLTSFSLFENGSSELYRGRSEGMVTVFEIDKENGGGEPIYNKEIISVFPLAVPRSSYEVSKQGFMAQYLTRLSEEIGRLFYEYYNGDDMSDAA